MQNDDLVTLSEAARLLGVSHTTVARMIERGELTVAETHPVTGRRRLRSGEIADILARAS